MRPRIWLVRSACPLVWGWNPDNRLEDAPISRQNSPQNWEVNCGPLSETTSVGSLWILKTWSTISCAVSLADGNLGSGIKWAALENRSTTVKTTVFPADGGRPVTKSRAMCDYGREGMGSGLRKPAGGELLDLVWAQTGHEATKRRMSRSLVGHQNLWRMMASVPLTPGWTANGFSFGLSTEAVAFFHSPVLPLFSSLLASSVSSHIYWRDSLCTALQTGKLWIWSTGLSAQLIPSSQGEVWVLGNPFVPTGRSRPDIRGMCGRGGKSYVLRLFPWRTLRISTFSAPW